MYDKKFIESKRKIAHNYSIEERDLTVTVYFDEYNNSILNLEILEDNKNSFTLTDDDLLNLGHMFLDMAKISETIEEESDKICKKLIKERVEAVARAKASSQGLSICEVDLSGALSRTLEELTAPDMPKVKKPKRRK